MVYHTRKKNRLDGYDYSSGGYYHITVCTKNKENLFWIASAPFVGEAISLPQVQARLSALGQIVEQAIGDIPKHYDNVSVDKYVIMPNHIHMILVLGQSDGRIISSPTVSQVIGQMKRIVSKRAGRSVWQTSFYDEIIRTDEDYLRIWQYIDANPFRWTEDEYWFEE